MWLTLSCPGRESRGSGADNLQSAANGVAKSSLTQLATVVAISLAELGGKVKFVRQKLQRCSESLAGATASRSPSCDSSETDAQGQHCDFFAADKAGNDSTGGL